MSWQFGGDRHIHKAIQAQADVRAVHAQGTVKAVKAQSDIVAITKRMETVARKLTRNAAGSTYWKKAAIEQAQLLDKMLDLAKSSENDQLIAAVQKCHHAWGGGNPQFRAALDSGMTITECLTKVLAGEQPGQDVPKNLLNGPAKIENPVTSDKVKETEVADSFSNPRRMPVHKMDAGPSDPASFWPAFWRTAGRNMVLPVIGCGLIALVYTVAGHRSTGGTQVTSSATPTMEAPTPISALLTPATTPGPETRPTIPIAQLATPTPLPAQPSPTPLRHEELIHGKAVRHKHPTHNSTRRQEQ